MSETKDYPSYLDYSKPRKAMTNADHIRSMTDEELVGVLLDCCGGSDCNDIPMNEFGSVDCFQCRMDWLKQPFEEG